MNDFTKNYEQYSVEAIKEANEFIEKSKGLYTSEDMPAFIAGYLQAILRKAQEK
jgi:hypothetical protein